MCACDSHAFVFTRNDERFRGPRRLVHPLPTSPYFARRPAVRARALIRGVRARYFPAVAVVVVVSVCVCVCLPVCVVVAVRSVADTFGGD